MNKLWKCGFRNGCTTKVIFFNLSGHIRPLARGQGVVVLEEVTGQFLPLRLKLIQEWIRYQSWNNRNKKNILKTFRGQNEIEKLRTSIAVSSTVLAEEGLVLNFNTPKWKMLLFLLYNQFKEKSKVYSCKLMCVYK